jgi:AAA+ superfamily predicted ATPase
MKKRNNIVFLCLFFLCKENASSFSYTRFLFDVLFPTLAIGGLGYSLMSMYGFLDGNVGSSNCLNLSKWVDDKPLDLAAFQKKVLSDCLSRSHKAKELISLPKFFDIFPESTGYMALGHGVRIDQDAPSKSLLNDKVSKLAIEDEESFNSQRWDYLKKKKKEFEEQQAAFLDQSLDNTGERDIRECPKKNITNPSGFVEFLLFSGTPGSGKTVLIKHFIKEFAEKKQCNLSQAICYEITLGNISSKYRGEQILKIQKIINQIKNKLKEGVFCVVYFPSVESLACSLDQEVGSVVTQESIHVIKYLTTFFSEFQNKENVKLVFMAETSRSHLIDNSFISFFSHRIPLQNPDLKNRLDFVSFIAEGKLFENEINEIARRMITLRDMCQLVQDIKERKNAFCQRSEGWAREQILFERKEFNRDIINHILNTKPTSTGENFLVKRA